MLFTVLIPVLIVTKQVYCLKELTGLSGFIVSPKLGSTYPNNLNQSWIVRVNPGYKVSLYFSEFDLEDSFDEDKGGACIYDYLKIQEGGHLLKKYCGSPKRYPLDAPRIGEEIYSTENSLTLNFVTDYSNEEPFPKGFKAHYKETDRDECYEMKVKVQTTFEDWDKLIYCNHMCHNVPGSYYCTCEPGFSLHSNKHICTRNCAGKVLTADSGTIISSKYPVQYSKLADCDWTIQKKIGIGIELRFVDQFGIEKHPQDGCVYDWIEYEDANGKLSERFCGKQLPKNGNWIITNSHLVKVHFISDLTAEEAGFKLEYKTKRVRCSRKLTAPVKGEITSASRPYYEFEDVVSFKCDKGYRLTGRSKLKCGSSGKWIGKEPTCEIKKCKHPTHLDEVINGRIKDNSISLTYGSNVTVWCFVWYEMTSGASVWECDDDEKWHPISEIIAPNDKGNIPECTPICGLKGNKEIRNYTYEFGDVINTTEDAEPLLGTHIIEGKEAKSGEWPWMAFIDLSGGYGLDAEEYCGGSLITPRTVLSAAHCFITTLKEDLKVYIGMNSRQVPRKEMQVFSVVDLIQHQSFSELNFDNDIAVLILNASVELGRYARPVCLPRSPREQSLPAKALSNDPNFQRQGVVAGWGYTAYVQGSAVMAIMLQMVRMPPIETSQCDKNLDIDGISTMTGNQFCAGFLDGGKDSCKGDSGGPIMFKDPARKKWFLNGVVSFGSSSRECGKRTFGIYTNVSRYISWIETFLRE